MTDNIVTLVPDSVGDDFKFDPEQVLDACRGKYTDLVVIGEDENGELFIHATSNLSRANLMMDIVKARLVSGDFSE